MDIHKALQFARGDTEAAAQLINVLAGPKRKKSEEDYDEYSNQQPVRQRGGLQKRAEQTLSDTLSVVTREERWEYFEKFATKSRIYDARAFFAAFDDLSIPYDDVTEYLLSRDDNLKENFEWAMSVLSYVFMVNIGTGDILDVFLRQHEARGFRPTISNIFKYFEYFYTARLDEFDDAPDKDFTRTFLRKYAENFESYLEYFERYFDIPLYSSNFDIPLNSSKIAGQIYNFFLYTAIIRRDGLAINIDFKTNMTLNAQPTNFPNFSKRWFTMSLYEYMDYRGVLERRGMYILPYVQIEDKIWYPDLKMRVIDFEKSLLDMIYDLGIFESPPSIEVLIHFFRTSVKTSSLYFLLSDHFAKTGKELALLDYAFRKNRYVSKRKRLLFGNFDMKKTSLPLQWILGQTPIREVMHDILTHEDFAQTTDDMIVLLTKTIHNKKTRNSSPENVQEFSNVINFLKSLNDPEAYDFNDVLSNMFMV